MISAEHGDNIIIYYYNMTSYSCIDFHWQYGRIKKLRLTIQCNHETINSSTINIIRAFANKNLSYHYDTDDGERNGGYISVSSLRKEKKENGNSPWPRVILFNSPFLCQLGNIYFSSLIFYTFFIALYQNLLPFTPLHILKRELANQSFPYSRVSCLYSIS